MDSSPAYEEQRLSDGSRVAVIGAGPAGSFFAYLLLQRARSLGLNLSVTLYDPKIFLEHGLPGCNMCAGAIGGRLVNAMEDAGLHLPPSVVRHRVMGYTFHSQHHWAQIPKTRGEEIYTVYRGQGPPRAASGHVSFDQFLLDKAKSAGAQYERKAVAGVTLHGNTVSVNLADGEKKVFDLVVGAFGVNSEFGKSLTFGYRPPETWQVCQAELETGRETVRKRFEDMIHIFTLGDKNVKFVAFTPKEDFITVSAIGRHVTIRDLKCCLEDPRIAPFLPAHWNIHCHCHPLLPVSSAQQPYAERFLIVGDAFISRFLKNGIESAFWTASIAVECVLEKGVSKQCLQQYYYKPCVRLFRFDNFCGKVMFKFNDLFASRPLLSEAHLTFARREQMAEDPAPRPLSTVLWHTFTGGASYKMILSKALNPALVTKLIALNLRVIVSHARLRSRDAGPALLLPEGGTVAIVGGGPSGCTCAIRLLQKAEALGREIRVLLYEGKTFERHYNQCIGVLSPPLKEFLQKYLRIKLPESLIKRRITGYGLHSGSHEILLKCPEGASPTYAVRRLEFDYYLLAQAIRAGAKQVNSRVMGIEFVHTKETDEVRIYSESGFERADVVVVACGLDDGILSRLESLLGEGPRYQRPPRVLKSYITKLEASPEFIRQQLDGNIHAYLPPKLRRVEFGAITPKDDHVTVNIAGRYVRSEDLDAFLDLAEVRRLLPTFNKEDLNYYEGRFPISPAAHAFGRRYVVIGDATGWMRSFKGKGINTAVITGIAAADTILEGGIDARAFRMYEEGCRDLRRDSFYGGCVRSLCNLAVTLKLFGGIIDLARTDTRLQSLLYKSVSGEDSFRNIIRGLFKIGFPFTAFWAFVKRSFRHAVARVSGRHSVREP